MKRPEDNLDEVPQHLTDLDDLVKSLNGDEEEEDGDDEEDDDDEDMEKAKGSEPQGSFAFAKSETAVAGGVGGTIFAAFTAHPNDNWRQANRPALQQRRREPNIKIG